MAITDYMGTSFTLSKASEAKVGGRLERTFTPDGNTYLCAIFTPTTVRTVSFGKRTFDIQKNLYCEVDVNIMLGDEITVDSIIFDVVELINTNNLNNHFVVGLVTKET